MGLKTPLYDIHLAAGAKIIDFGGWDMPLSYGSQLEEHRSVRRDSGIFDVSHMCVIDLTGASVRQFLSRLLANDVAKLTVPGSALYSCMLRPSGGVIDDLLAYYLTATWFRLVVNAGTRRKDLEWIEQQAAPFGVAVRERTDLAILAVQGPLAREKTASLLSPAHRESALGIARFSAAAIDTWFLARTGYTGEDGFEIMVPAGEAAAVWRSLVARDVSPAGLGARDTLRLEAGMNLYGSDMDESRHPLESGLGWTVAFEPEARDFIGRESLARVRAEGCDRLVGLVLEERGMLRGHQTVRAAPQDRPGGAAGEVVGEITSGSFSPTLNRAIAFARVRRGTAERVEVDIRGRQHAARIVKPPFVRNGKVSIDLQPPEL